MSMDENQAKPPVPWRFITEEAIQRLNARLNIREDQYSQDWEFEVSESNRLPEYLDIYENELTDEDDKFALMWLIIQAVDGPDMDEAMWSRVREHLKADFSLHQWTVCYWCNLDEEDLEHCFDITPRLRELWHECRPA